MFQGLKHKIMTPEHVKIEPFDILIPDPDEIGETKEALEKQTVDSLTDDLLARFDGRWVWSYRTFLELRKRGFPVSLTLRPKSGIVTIGHVNTWRECCKTLPKDVPIVACQADRRRLARYCVNVVQSPTCRTGFFIPHWPEPRIKPRTVTDTGIKRAAYFGEVKGLEWRIHNALECRLHEIGICYEVRDRKLWRDYSDVDVAIALRYNWKARGEFKPGSKFYNSILGRVPFIATPEPAYMEFDPGQKMWRAAHNVTETVAVLEQLKIDKKQYESMLICMSGIDAIDITDRISQGYEEAILLAQARRNNRLDYQEIISRFVRDIPLRIKNRAIKIEASSTAK